jgi:hypothetical protein
VIRSRLSLDDAAFRVVDLDPAVDLAEQLDLLFDKHAASSLKRPDALLRVEPGR